MGMTGIKWRWRGATAPVLPSSPFIPTSPHTFSLMPVCLLRHWRSPSALILRDARFASSSGRALLSPDVGERDTRRPSRPPAGGGEGWGAGRRLVLVAGA